MELDEQLDIQRNSRYYGESNSLRPKQMIEEFSSPSLNNLKDSIEDALTSESPQDILDCIMLTLKRNSQYHRVCARHSKEVLDLLHGVDKSKNVVELNAAAEDDHSWVDIVANATDIMSEDELVANGYQLTDTGWVKS
jgi:hypothetical protein